MPNMACMANCSFVGFPHDIEGRVSVGVSPNLKDHPLDVPLLAVGISEPDGVVDPEHIS